MPRWIPVYNTDLTSASLLAASHVGPTSWSPLSHESVTDCGMKLGVKTENSFTANPLSEIISEMSQNRGKNDVRAFSERETEVGRIQKDSRLYRQLATDIMLRCG